MKEKIVADFIVDHRDGNSGMGTRYLPGTEIIFYPQVAPIPNPN
jgi:hypothetical protein